MVTEDLLYICRRTSWSENILDWWQDPPLFPLIPFLPPSYSMSHFDPLLRPYVKGPGSGDYAWPSMSGRKSSYISSLELLLDRSSPGTKRGWPIRVYGGNNHLSDVVSCSSIYTHKYCRFSRSFRETGQHTSNSSVCGDENEGVSKEVTYYWLKRFDPKRCRSHC